MGLKENILAEFCSKVCKKKDQAIIGTATYRPYQIFLETMEPWERTINASADYPQELDILIQKQRKSLKIPISINAIAPDQQYSLPGRRKVFVFIQNPKNPLEYETLVGSCKRSTTLNFFRSLFASQQSPFTGSIDLNSLDKNFSIAAEKNTRDIMLCCHGQRDPCCGTFGLEIYNYLRNHSKTQQENCRIWKTSHIGGHKFAPTLIEFPSMRVWGHITQESAEKISFQHEPVSDLIHNYRGFSGFQHPFEQVAEKDFFQEMSWNYPDKMPIKWRSKKNKEDHSGSIEILNRNGAVFFSSIVKQTGSSASQASCFDSKIKSYPLFHCSSKTHSLL